VAAESLFQTQKRQSSKRFLPPPIDFFSFLKKMEKKKGTKKMNSCLVWKNQLL